MNLAMRQRLERTIGYHDAMAEHYSAEHDGWLARHKRQAQRAAAAEMQEDGGDSSSRKKASAPADIPDEALRSPHSAAVEMHAGAQQMLREVLDSTPIRPVIADEIDARNREDIPRRDTRVGVQPVSRVLRRQ